MALIDVKGVRVNFPFTPYPCQVTYMEKVLQCLQQEENGVLESPTGTGKTLCLLCSSLAWLEGRKAQVEFSRQAGIAAIVAEAGGDDPGPNTLAAVAASLQRSTGSACWGSSEFVVPKIIYASRTHSQLSQAVQELKRTAYNGIKTAIIGSRDQLCVHEQIKKEKNNNAKVHMCRAKVSARRCHYYNVLEDLKRNTEPRQIVGSVADIEDLVSHGTKSKICPYYLARELKSDADIIFMPYNYLLDPKLRRAHGVELQGNIIIFDEAHNLEQICEESASFELSSVDLATAIEETTQLGVKLTEMVSAEADLGDTGDAAAVPEFTLEDVIKLKKTLLELEELVDSEPLVNKAAIKPGLFMFELMEKVNITFGNKSFVIDLLDKMISHFNSDGTSGVLHSKGAGLSKFVDALKIIFNQEPNESAPLSQHKELLAQYYKVHIQQKESNTHQKRKVASWASGGGQEKSERVLSYWCFSPGYSMQDLRSQGVKAIILTSGTLSPIESFTAGMQIPFTVHLQNPHVIEKHQVWVGTLSSGPDSATLNSNYHNRFTEAYQSSLGNSIVNFARVVPNGLLVFFPSYPVMEKCVEMWKSGNIWERIMAYKPVIVESKGKDAFTEAIDDFYVKINDTKMNGAIFMAVCRGKVSEGLDFADNNGRAVVLTGLPFPPMKDPRVILKMQHLDDLTRKRENKGLTGQQWYRQQATRAVNQAIGRVIRHKDDFGAILLCDTRFSSSESVNGLPLWLKPHVTKYTNFGRAVRDMLNFFKVAEKALPAPRVRCGRGKEDSSRSGSEGAFFEPTLSRRTTPVEHASEVACHVPGFSRHGASDMSSLKSQYSQSDGGDGGASRGQKRGLLHALDATELQMKTPTCTPDSESSCSNDGNVKIHSKRRKIVIKPKTPSSESAKPAPSSADNKKAPQTVHHNLAEKYMVEVKSTLVPLDFKRFSAMLLQYKKSEYLTAVTPVLADLFTSNSERFHLFRKFYQFVRPKHKKEFDQLCQSLTGLSCGYKPEHALTQKRLTQSSEGVSADKGQKLESASVSSGRSTLGQWSAPSSGQSGQGVSEGPPTIHPAQTKLTAFSAGHRLTDQRSSGREGGDPKHAGDKGGDPKQCASGNKGDNSKESTSPWAASRTGVSQMSLDQKPSGQSASISQQEKNAAFSSSGKSDPVYSDSNMPATTVVTTNENSASSRGIQDKQTIDVPKPTGQLEQNIEGECSSGKTESSANRDSENGLVLDKEKLQKLQKETNKVVPKSGYRCLKCKKEAHVPFRLHPCDHVCCFVCWRRILEGDRACPGGCDQQVRKRNLRQLLFASGQDL